MTHLRTPNAFVGSAHDLVVDSTDAEWNVHFDHDSQVELGKRCAVTTIEVLGIE